MSEQKECPHPGCKVKDYTPPPGICDCPTMLYVPPGQHHHHKCPVHGDTIITSPMITC